MHGFCRRQVSHGLYTASPCDGRSLRSRFLRAHTNKPSAVEPTLWRMHSANPGERHNAVCVRPSLPAEATPPGLQGYPFHQGPLTSMAISSSGLSAITGSEDATAKLSNLATGKASVACTAHCAAQHSLLLQVLGTLNAHTASVESVGFCDEATYAATASLDGRVIVWDIQVRQACPSTVSASLIAFVVCSVHLSPLIFVTSARMMQRCQS